MVRSAIEHEDHLTNHRLTWLLTAQGFLIGAFFVAQSSVLQLKNPMTQALCEFALAIVFFAGIRLCMIVGVGVALASEHTTRLLNWCDANIEHQPFREFRSNLLDLQTVSFKEIIPYLLIAFSVLCSVIIGNVIKLNPLIQSIRIAMIIALIAMSVILGFSFLLLWSKNLVRSYRLMTWWFATTPGQFDKSILTSISTPPILGYFEVPRMLSIRWIPALFMFLNIMFMSICLKLGWDYYCQFAEGKQFLKAPVYVESIKVSENAGQPSFEIQFKSTDFERQCVTIESLAQSQELDRIIRSLRSSLNKAITSDSDSKNQASESKLQSGKQSSPETKPPNSPSSSRKSEIGIRKSDQPKKREQPLNIKSNESPSPETQRDSRTQRN